MEVALDVELEKNCRLITSSASGGVICALKVKSAEIEFIDESIDEAYRLVFVDVVIKALWQQRDLVSVCASMNHFIGHLTANGVADFYFWDAL